MERFHKSMCLTCRFDVVDAQGGGNIVEEYAVYIVPRDADASPGRRMLGGVLYRLQDGTAVRRTRPNCFESADEGRRFTVTGALGRYLDAMTAAAPGEPMARRAAR